MSAVLLGAFVTGLALIAAPRLARARWVLRAPGLAIFTWQMTCVTALVAVSTRCFVVGDSGGICPPALGRFARQDDITRTIRPRAPGC